MPEYRHVGVGTFQTTDLMRQYLQEVLDSGRISYGPFSKQLEQTFARRHQCAWGTLSNSGTSSLQVALQAMKEIHGWTEESEVLVPALTFIATANIVHHVGLRPVYVDIEPVSYGMDPDLAEQALTPRTVAMIPVHLFGQPCAGIWKLRELAARNRLQVLEDSCETAFVHSEGLSVGAMGHIACFSFYVAHLLVAGVGGIALTNDPDYAAKMRTLVNHGLETTQLNLDNQFAPQPMPGRRFRFTSRGHSYRLTEFEAAVALAGMSTWREMIAQRQANAAYLTEHLQDLAAREILILPQVAHGNEHAWMMYPLLVHPAYPDLKEKLTRDLNEAGVETRDLPSLIDQPVAYLDPSTLPIATHATRQGFYVGCHQHLEEGDLAWIVQVLQEATNGL